MGITVFNNCKKMLKGKEGQVFTLEELQNLVSVHIGGQRRTIDQAIRVMGMGNLIEDIGNWRFKVINGK